MLDAGEPLSDGAAAREHAPHAHECCAEQVPAHLALIVEGFPSQLLAQLAAMTKEPAPTPKIVATAKPVLDKARP